MFDKILIANRGEIAVRIIRACREMGIATVAVYSEADQRALHVRLADEAVPIGQADPTDSYLNFPRIIQAARDTKSQAIHPGYGFLSENPEFARHVGEAGVTFIGPPPDAIRLMGNKAAAREQMKNASVPVIPGYEGPDDDVALQRAAEEIGYPIMVKAASGGGGRGMRTVRDKQELAEAISAARFEARRAFGEDRLILEHYVEKAHHIEFQILADQVGNIIHLFERECSVQRRHQKVIEETPSILLDDEFRALMGAAAITAAQAIGYQNAGTVEFIVNPRTRQFYFLEMNTRIQVEHPVTEMVTGLDLVQWQLRIAAGEPLPFRQDDLRQRGHAIECRLYAEDPAQGFLPATGPILQFIEPRGPGIRVDAGFTTGDDISVHYDSLIAKLIAYAEDRPAAIRKMQSALKQIVLLGVTTNWQFLTDVLTHPDFNAGNAYTTWIEDRFTDWQPPQCDIPIDVLVAAAVTQFQPVKTKPFNAREENFVVENTDTDLRIDPYNPWRTSNEYRVSE